MKTTRRQVLAGAGALLLPGTARAFGSTTRIDVAELDLGNGTLQRPNAWQRLLYEVSSTTSVECEPLYTTTSWPASTEAP